MWIYDVEIETTKELATTGGTVWDAAKRACTFLEASGEHIGLLRPGAKVLELGAGCGFLGLTIARNLPQAQEVCLTEQEEGGALEHLRLNVSQNSHLPGISRATVAPCDWCVAASHLRQQPSRPCTEASSAPRAAASSSAAADSCKAHGKPGLTNLHEELKTAAAAPAGAAPRAGAGAVQASVELALAPAVTTAPNHPTAPAAAMTPHSTPPQEAPAVAEGESSAAATGQSPCCCPTCTLLESHWDFVVGSDLVYNRAGTHMLPQVLKRLAKPGCQIYYVHTKHRFDGLDIEFMEQLGAAGLQVEEVWEPGEPPPPPSPPPLTELFPEFRIAVFTIRPC